MKIKSDGYFGKNIRFTCEVCGCVYDVESRDDWKINLVNMQIQEDSRISFKKVPDYSVVCPKCKHEKRLGYDPSDVPYMTYSIVDLLSEREDWEDRFKVFFR